MNLWLIYACKIVGSKNTFNILEVIFIDCFCTLFVDSFSDKEDDIESVTKLFFTLAKFIFKIYHRILDYF